MINPQVGQSPLALIFCHFIGYLLTKVPKILPQLFLLFKIRNKVTALPLYYKFVIYIQLKSDRDVRLQYSNDMYYLLVNTQN